MKNFKKIAAALLVTALLAQSAIAATFDDVETSDENFIAIEYLVSIGTLEGYEDGTFLPDQTINRAELMKVLVAGQGISPDEDKYQNCFPDVTDDWYAKYVCYASEQGWVNGYPDNTFKPGQTVNKVEAVKMLINALGLDGMLPESVDETLFDDTNSSDWYASYLYVAKDLNLLEISSGNYDPSGEMDRGNTAEYIFRTLVTQELESDAYNIYKRDEFLTTHELTDLIPEGEAQISYVFYDGEVYQVESDEYIEITNIGQGILQLEGYYIMGSSGEEKFTFPELDLEPDENVKVYTNQGDYSFESEDAVWSNGGETVYLYDSSDNLVDEYSY